ncbi:MAG: GGDEF domain-containing protein, partial [Oscillospiraceae bacterium]|nr:GGDEF domain-containing protein [Oscillospiraceae bacterium]
MNPHHPKELHQISITFARLAIALANDYESIFVINAENHSYMEYTNDPRNMTLTERSSGSDFFADAVRNTRNHVHPEDQERCLRVLSREYMLDELDREKAFSLRYRLIVNGEPKYYYLKTVRGSGADRQYIMIGVKNIDEQTRKEIAAAAESRKLAEISSLLARRYEVIYQVNVQTGEYIEYTTSEKYARLNIRKKGNDFFRECQINIQKDIYHEDRPMMSRAMEREQFLCALQENGSTSLNYRLILDGEPQYVTLFAVRSTDDGDHIIIAVANVDAAKRREMAYQKALGSAMDLAQRDALTGVRNKHAYVQAELEMDTRIAAKRNPMFAVVVCDINGLKQVNDTEGHSAGDAFIRHASEMISETFTESEVYRIGGDEFAVLLVENDFEQREALMYELYTLQSRNRR